MIRRPPRSTLFPYTTLFRSQHHCRIADADCGMHEPAVGPGQPGFLSRAERLLVDRKSTRLNSSHGYISYAVFCLKKKKKNTHYSLMRACNAHPHRVMANSIT